MIPGENLVFSSAKFEPFKVFHSNCAQTNVLNPDSNFNKNDEILKNQLLKKKEKYSIDCPLCKSKVMPFRIDFHSIIFVCVNKEVNYFIYLLDLLKSAQNFTSIHSRKNSFMSFNSFVIFLKIVFFPV